MDTSRFVLRWPHISLALSLLVISCFAVLSTRTIHTIAASPRTVPCSATPTKSLTPTFVPGGSTSGSTLTATRTLIPSVRPCAPKPQAGIGPTDTFTFVPAGCNGTFVPFVTCTPTPTLTSTNPFQPPTATPSNTATNTPTSTPTQMWSEVDIPCRWQWQGLPRFLNYTFQPLGPLGDDLTVTNPTWAARFQTAVNDWNSAQTKLTLIGAVDLLNHDVSFGVYSADDNTGGITDQICQFGRLGGLLVEADASGNTYYDSQLNENRKQISANHETGHTFGLGHIINSDIALMSPAGPKDQNTFLPQAPDIDLLNSIYK